MTTRLTLSHRAFHTLAALARLADTEVAAIGIPRPPHPGPPTPDGSPTIIPASDFYIEDFAVPLQTCTAASFEFDASSYAALTTAEVMEGRSFPRVIAHTHPGSSATPSAGDDANWREYMATQPWAAMLILGRSFDPLALSKSITCRYGVSHPEAPLPLHFELPVTIDFESPLPLRTRPELLALLSNIRHPTPTPTPTHRTDAHWADHFDHPGDYASQRREERRQKDWANAPTPPPPRFSGDPRIPTFGVSLSDLNDIATEIACLDRDDPAYAAAFARYDALTDDDQSFIDDLISNLDFDHPHPT